MCTLIRYRKPKGIFKYLVIGLQDDNPSEVDCSTGKVKTGTQSRSGVVVLPRQHADVVSRRRENPFSRVLSPWDDWVSVSGVIFSNHSTGTQTGPSDGPTPEGLS